MLESDFADLFFAELANVISGDFSECLLPSRAGLFFISYSPMPAALPGSTG